MAAQCRLHSAFCRRRRGENDNGSRGEKVKGVGCPQHTSTLLRTEANEDVLRCTG